MTDEVTFRRTWDESIEMWIGPVTKWVEDEDDYYGGSDEKLPPTYTFTKDQAAKMVIEVLRGHVGYQGPMGATGRSA